MRKTIVRSVSVVALGSVAGVASAQYVPPPQPVYVPPPVAVEPPPVIGYGPTLGVRFGGGFDLENGSFNLFGLGLGLNFEFAPENSPIYIGLDGTYFLGEGVNGPGDSHPSRILQIMGWGGYNAVLTDTFVFRAGLGVGLEQWKFTTLGVDDLGVVFGGLVEFQYYLIPELHVDLMARYTGSWHGGSESLDGVAAMLGVGYAF